MLEEIKMNLEINTRDGTLEEMLQPFDRSTILHAIEIQKKRLNDDDLLGMCLYTSDFPLYTVEKGKAVLYLADSKHNLIFQNLDDAVNQIHESENYFPKNSEIGSVIKARSTLRVEISDLKLEDDDSEISYFDINTEDYSTLNNTQKTFAERIHGKGKTFDKMMKMLRHRDIETTRFYVLNPEYVQERLHAKKAKSLARISSISSVDGNCNFFADDMDIDQYGYAIAWSTSVV